ncbi:hypothetical protein C8P63_1538 [Melghirimyces profundicolus]|uniref:Uncharacterized protein n=1 Tax=Melghirimyces profundicolus TaxID=1242148 RepID=A0A2T6ATU8_9BACL|nr:hypothetical protein C8P63_1538 [Melghirimyces profundicolus]
MTSHRQDPTVVFLLAAAAGPVSAREITTGELFSPEARVLSTKILSYHVSGKTKCNPTAREARPSPRRPGFSMLPTRLGEEALAHGPAGNGAWDPDCHSLPGMTAVLPAIGHHPGVGGAFPTNRFPPRGGAATPGPADPLPGKTATYRPTVPSRDGGRIMVTVHPRMGFSVSRFFNSDSSSPRRRASFILRVTPIC